MATIVEDTLRNAFAGSKVAVRPPSRGQQLRITVGMLAALLGGDLGDDLRAWVPDYVDLLLTINDDGRTAVVMFTEEIVGVEQVRVNDQPLSADPFWLDGSTTTMPVKLTCVPVVATVETVVPLPVPVRTLMAIEDRCAVIARTALAAAELAGDERERG